MIKENYKYCLNKAETLYWRWVNDYLTIRGFAEHHGLTEKQAVRVINRGRTLCKGVKS